MPTANPDLGGGDPLSGYWKINGTYDADGKSYHMGTLLVTRKNVIGVINDDDVWQVGIPAMVRDDVTFYQ